jgi:hypothetical protein
MHASYHGPQRVLGHTLHPVNPNSYAKPKENAHWQDLAPLENRKQFVKIS